MQPKAMTLDMAEIARNPILCTAIMSLLFKRIADFRGEAPKDLEVFFDIGALKDAEAAFDDREMLHANLVFGDDGHLCIYTAEA